MTNGQRDRVIPEPQRLIRYPKNSILQNVLFSRNGKEALLIMLGRDMPQSEPPRRPRVLILKILIKHRF